VLPKCHPQFAIFISQKHLGAEGISAIFERANGIPAVIESLAKLSLERAPEGKVVSMEVLQEILESWDLT